jgi:hypothetical protein
MTTYAVALISAETDMSTDAPRNTDTPNEAPDWHGITIEADLSLWAAADALEEHTDVAEAEKTSCAAANISDAQAEAAEAFLVREAAKVAPEETST